MKSWEPTISQWKMEAMLNQRGRRTRAFHEAGHAVAARLLGVGIEQIKFELGDILVCTRSAGHVARGTPDFRNGLEADIQVVLAGLLAQRIYRPQSYRKGSAAVDLQNAVNLAALHCLEPDNRAEGEAFSALGRLPPEGLALIDRLQGTAIKLIKPKCLSGEFLNHMNHV